MTVGTNALLEERGARTALVATARLRRPARDRPPGPPAASTASARRSRRRWSSRELRFEAAERIGPDGRGRAARRRTSRSGWRRLMREQRRRVGRDLPALLLPRPRARAARSPTHLRERAARRPRLRLARGAAALPRVRALLDDGDRRLPLARCSAATWAGSARRPRAPGCREPLVMQSSGGVAPAAEAARAGAWSVLSGPGRRRGRRRPAGPRSAATATRSASTWAAPPATSAWSRTARCGAPTRAQIGGRAIQLPMVDVHTVGAGGGSIGWRDAGGALRVGPRSAGADPGPACYGRGGTEPTVTDANLAARLPRRRLARWPAASSSTPRRPSAAVARARRARSASSALRDRRGDRPGRQPGDGAGAARGHRRARRRPARLRAAALRRRRADARRGDRRRARDRADPLPARRRRPLGARPLRLRAPPRHRPHGDAERRRAERRADRRRGRRADREPLGAGLERGRARGRLRAALRGQAFELPVPGPARARPGRAGRALRAAHEERYGHRDPEGEVVLVDIRLALVVPGPAAAPARRPAGRARARAPRRSASTASGSRRRSCAASPPAGTEAEGPVVFELPEATLVLPPGWRAEVDERGTIVARSARADEPRCGLDPITLQVLVGGAARRLRRDGRGADPLRLLGQHQGAPRLLDRALRRRAASW